MGNSSHNEAPGHGARPFGAGCRAPSPSRGCCRSGLLWNRQCEHSRLGRRVRTNRSTKLLSNRSCDTGSFAALGLVWGEGRARCQSDAAGGPRARRPANLDRPAAGLGRHLVGGGRAYAQEVQITRDCFLLGSRNYARGRKWRVHHAALRVRRVRGVVGFGGRGYGGYGDRARRQVNELLLEIRQGSGPKPLTSSNEKGLLALWGRRPRCGPLILYI